MHDGALPVASGGLTNKEQTFTDFSYQTSRKLISSVLKMWTIKTFWATLYTICRAVYTVQLGLPLRTTTDKLT